MVVSTEDAEIAETARNWGAEVPFYRPAHLAGDNVPAIQAVAYTVARLEAEENAHFDYVMGLLPTAPLRAAGDIDQAIELLTLKGTPSLVSVPPVRDHPDWMKVLDGDGVMSSFIPRQGRPPRRQDLKPVYVLNGAIYLAQRSLLGDEPSWYGERTTAYIMPQERLAGYRHPWDMICRVGSERAGGCNRAGRRIPES